MLRFAVENEHNFTEHDPDGIKKIWIEQSREQLEKYDAIQEARKTKRESR